MRRDSTVQMRWGTDQEEMSTEENHDASNWRELLALILRNPREKQQLLDELKARIEGQLLADVQFAGYHSDPTQFLAGIDVGLLPTYYSFESLPLVIIEYLAQSKPVMGNTAKMPGTKPSADSPVGRYW